MTVETRKTYPAIDLFKFGAALLIVTIHTIFYWHYDAPLPQHSALSLMAFARNGVPFFFMVSAFFLYGRQGKDVSWHQVGRLLKVYLAWGLLTLPLIVYTYYVHRYLEAGESLSNLGLSLFKGLFFQGLYAGSWFILVNVWCILIVKYARLKNVPLLIIGALLYVLAVMDSAYYVPLSGYLPFREVQQIVGAYCFFVPAGLLYFMIGKVLAEHKDRIGWLKSHRKLLYAATLVMVVVNIGELWHCDAAGYIGGRLRTDHTFTLPLSAVLLFLSCLTIELKDRPVYKRLRALSTIVYLGQFPVIRILFYVGVQDVALYAATITIVILFGLLVLRLARRWPALRTLY